MLKNCKSGGEVHGIRRLHFKDFKGARIVRLVLPGNREEAEHVIQETQDDTPIFKIQTREELSRRYKSNSKNKK